MIRKSGSTCRLTFETADSSGSAAAVRADVKVVSSSGHSGGLIERTAAHSGRPGDSVLKCVIRCLTTVYPVPITDSNGVFTLLCKLYMSGCSRRSATAVIGTVESN